MAHQSLRRGLVVAVLAVTPLVLLGTAAHADERVDPPPAVTPMQLMHGGGTGTEMPAGMGMPAADPVPGATDANRLGLVGMGALAFFAAGSAATAMRHLPRAG